MLKALFSAIILVGVYSLGYAQTMNNVEESVRYRVPQDAVQLQNSANSSETVDIRNIAVLESKSSAQLQELGSVYGFSRSGSQLDELGSVYGFSRSGSQLDELGSVYGFSRSGSQLDDLGSVYGFSRSGSQLDELGSVYGFSR